MFRYTMTRTLFRSAKPALPTATSRTFHTNTSTLDAVKLAEVREAVHKTKEPELNIPVFAPGSKVPVSKIWRDIKRVNDASAVKARSQAGRDLEYREVHGKVRDFGYDFDLYPPGFMIKTTKPAGSPILNAVASLKEKVSTAAKSTTASVTQTGTIASSATMDGRTDSLASRTQDQRTEAAMKNMKPLMEANATLNSEAHVMAARQKVAEGIMAWKPSAKRRYSYEDVVVKEEPTIVNSNPLDKVAEVIAVAVAKVPAAVKDWAADEERDTRQISSMASLTQASMAAHREAITGRVQFVMSSGRSAADLDNAFL